MIPLQFFGCTDVSKPVEDSQPTIEYDADASFLSDAMPLVSVYSQEPDHLETTIRFYEAQNVDFKSVGTTNRSQATEPREVTFTEYWLTNTSTSPVPVYALTSCYLHYLGSERSDPNLLGGAKAGSGEEILVLKPLPNSWAESLPGTVPVLVQCAYLNVALDEPMLKILIERSATQSFHKKIYKKITGFEAQDKDSWASDYFDLFKQHPEVSIAVPGGIEQIALTKANSPTDSSQRISMFFNLAGELSKWTDHDDDVKAFFEYYQRRNGLGGHPLIAKLLGRSVRSGTVDVIPRSEKLFGKRSKGKLITDFAALATSTDPSYHPLALDPDQHPHRLIIPRPPADAILPIPNLTFRPDHFLTRLKIGNPLHLDLEIDTATVPAGVSISPLSFNESEQVVEVKVTGTIPPSQPGALLEATMKVTTADGTLVQDLNLTFMDFHTVSVKFFQLSDTQPNHQPDIDEPRLRDLIAYANEILGRHSNVYIYPVEEPDPDTGQPTILHKFHYQGDLGDPIVNGLDSIYLAFPSPSNPEDLAANINVVFVWNAESTESMSGRGGDVAGETYGIPDVGYNLILLDTKKNGMPTDVPHRAKGLVHEMGHWFSRIFILWPNERANRSKCSDSDKHFTHPPDECPKGDWTFYGNLMGVSGGQLITVEQAKVFNGHADQVTAYLVH